MSEERGDQDRPERRPDEHGADGLEERGLVPAQVPVRQPTASAPKGLPGNAKRLPVPKENLNVAVTSAAPAAHQGPSNTPATALTACWNGKTRVTPTGTANDDNRTPLPNGRLLDRKVFFQPIRVGGEVRQRVE